MINYGFNFFLLLLTIFFGFSWPNSWLLRYFYPCYDIFTHAVAFSNCHFYFLPSQPLDAYPRGRVFLGFRGSLAHVVQDRKDLDSGMFSLQTPVGKVFFCADSHPEKVEWLNVFRFVQDQPMRNLVDEARERVEKVESVCGDSVGGRCICGGTVTVWGD